MSQNKFKVGDLVQYHIRYNGTPVKKGVGIVITVHDVTDATYDKQERFVYDILSQTEQAELIVQPHHLKKIK